MPNLLIDFITIIFHVNRFNNLWSDVVILCNQNRPINLRC